MSNKVLLAGGVSHLLLANGSDFLLLALSDSVAVQSTPFVNLPTQRRPFLGRTHVSQMRGTEDVRARRGGNSLRPYLRKQRQSHYYPVVTGGSWILANGVWDDAGVWDDSSVWEG